LASPLLQKVIVPQYFYHLGDKSASVLHIDYIRNNWGDKGKNMSLKELKIEASSMITLQKACNKYANDDLSMYTSTMAAILDVKCKVLGCEQPVHDRHAWIQSVVDDPSNLQIEKWIFAWLYVQSTYNKLVSRLAYENDIPTGVKGIDKVQLL